MFEPVRVTVAASSANLGPGYDSFGLALDWRDSVEFFPADRHTADVTGEGADDVPRDERHLILATVLGALEDLGMAVGGVRLRTHNTIPHGRGLGSSAAAVAAGVLGAWGIARPGQPVDAGWALTAGTRVEGHPDNVGAALFGGFIVAWTQPSGAAHWAQVPVHPTVRVRSYVPTSVLPTDAARAALPSCVPHADAAANASRAGLLVHALSREPRLLSAATEDFLHQRYRADLMPAGWRLIGQLRAAGHAAFVSGAGPTVLVLTDRLGDLPSVGEGFVARDHHVGRAATINGHSVLADMTQAEHGATVDPSEHSSSHGPAD